MTGPLETRCSGGAGCREVVDRLRAADLLEYLEADKECADRLREQARRWAEVHNYGQAVDLEDAS